MENKYQEALNILRNIEQSHNYKQIGSSLTPNSDTLQELVDKEKPKKLVRYNFSKEWHCPNCGSGNGEYEGTVGTHNYCHYCGQTLD